MSVYAQPAHDDAFRLSWRLAEELIGWLGGAESGALTHAELEEQLTVRGRQLQRQLLQDHFDLRAVREERLAVVTGDDGVARAHAEPEHQRMLATVFGPVAIERIAYRAKGADSRFVADARASLPKERYSHGLRRLAAQTAVAGSFTHAQQHIAIVTGVTVGKRQIEALTLAAAADIDSFYASRRYPACPAGDVLVLSADAKGIVMRPQALRETTARTAASRKLATRLSKGEKANRKRMAEVVTVYHCTPAPRGRDDVIGPPGVSGPDRRAGPKAAGKWLHASVTDDTTTVIAAMFDHAQRVDPGGNHTWIALVDGNNHQIDAIGSQARARDRPVTIIVDFVHVLEYLWKAAWCLHNEGDPAAETWVAEQARDILAGRATRVAGRIQRQTSKANLNPDKRKAADTTVIYLLNKARYLRYHHALAAGWPIATGVIEGACRHLVKDRMDITGARWGLDGAEAILKLRALTSNGDFDTYWTYHLQQEHQRVHASRYVDGVIPS